MGKATKTYEICEPVSGSFVTSAGERLTYELDAGIVAESDVHPEVLKRLIRTGAAVTPTTPKPEASEMGDPR